MLSVQSANLSITAKIIPNQFITQLKFHQFRRVKEIKTNIAYLKISINLKERGKKIITSRHPKVPPSLRISPLKMGQGIIGEKTEELQTRSSMIRQYDGGIFQNRKIQNIKFLIVSLRPRVLQRGRSILSHVGGRTCQCYSFIPGGGHKITPSIK